MVDIITAFIVDMKRYNFIFCLKSSLKAWKFPPGHSALRIGIAKAAVQAAIAMQNPWPGNFHMLLVEPKKKKKKFIEVRIYSPSLFTLY